MGSHDFPGWKRGLVRLLAERTRRFGSLEGRAVPPVGTTVRHASHPESESTGILRPHEATLNPKSHLPAACVSPLHRCIAEGPRAPAKPRRFREAINKKTTE